MFATRAAAKLAARDVKLSQKCHDLIACGSGSACEVCPAAFAVQLCSRALIINSAPLISASCTFATRTSKSPTNGTAPAVPMPVRNLLRVF